MKKICLFVELMMFCFIFPISLYAQNYDRLWREVETFRKKDLPRSVIEKSEKIFSLAVRDNDLPQMIKAFMVCSEYKARLSRDSIQLQKDRLMKWAASETDVVGKSVLNSILAYIYATEIPLRVDSVISCLRLSLEEKDLLASRSAALFYPVVISRELSKEYFDDNMYDFLARQAVRTLLSVSASGNEQKIHNEIIGIYDSLIALYSCVDTPYYDRKAEALTREARLAYLSDHCVYSKDRLSSDDAMNEFNNLAHEYKDIDVYCDIVLKLACKYSSNGKMVEALSEVKNALALYPDTKWTRDMNNMIKFIEAPGLDINIPFVYPRYSSDIEVSYKNITSVTIEAYRLGLSPVSEKLRDRKNYEQLIKKHGSRVAVNNYTLPPTTDYKTRTTRLKYKLPEDGIYVLKLYSKQQPDVVSYEVAYVSPYQCIVIQLPHDRKELVAVDRMTGHPVPNAEIVSYIQKDGKYQIKNIYSTDSNGSVIVNVANDNLEYLNVRTPGNDFMDISFFYSSGIYQNTDDTGVREQTTVFTDRSIYRPGQKVYLSGVKYVQKGDSVSVLKGEEVTVKVTDANGKEVESLKAVTDDFGVYSTGFVLKQNVMPGYFGIKADNAYGSIRVDEYKRPTFDVAFEKNDAEYSLGDSVRAEAKAMTFAGAPLRMAKVEYRIVRMDNVWWRYNGAEKEILTGEAMTDADGKFHIDFCLMKPDDDSSLLSDVYYRFNITATVTSLSGETQLGEYSISVGNKSLGLRISNLPNLLAKEKIGSIRFEAFNCENMPVETSIKYYIYKLDDEEKIVDKAVFSGEENAQESFVPYALNSLSSGKYRMRIVAFDLKGQEVSVNQDFVLFSLADSAPPFKTVEWFYQDGDTFADGKDVDFYVGSSDEDVYLMIDVFTEGKRLESRRITFSNSILKFTYGYKEEYGDGITVCFSFMRKGLIYRKVISLAKPVPEKNLVIRWETFRDKLVPGQKEEWKLTVRDKYGKPVNASMLASAYDASLDELYAHGWFFGLYFGRKIPNVVVNRLNVYDNSYIKVGYEYVNRDNGIDFIYGDGFTQFIPFLWNYYGSRGIVMVKAQSNGLFYSNVSSDELAVQLNSRKTPKVVSDTNLSVAEVTATAEEMSGAVNGNSVQALRENFSETAFYYPRLHTDSTGTVSLSFVMPDALTEWNFNGFVHTKNMDYGLIKTSFTTSKPFMVQPNVPRFVRVGDESSISSSLINLSDGNVDGKVTMTISNPINGKVVYTSTEKFNVSERETGVITFKYKVTEDIDVLVCTVMAEAGEFSDGERHYIPVLSDKQLIIENIPVQLRGDETKTVDTEKLFNAGSLTANNRKLTVEMTANPYWYVIQALPVLSTPASDDAMSWATSFYANSLSLLIVRTCPWIKQVLDTWLSNVKNEKDFWSELSKNEELKNIVIDETPWLVDAENEVARKQRIALLFDVNGMNDRLSTAVSNMAQLQLADGSWAWFKGMSSSSYITQQIMLSLARLKGLGVIFDSRMSNIYQKAFKYLKSEADKCYNSMLENEKSYVPQDLIMSYLYICSIDKDAARWTDTEVNAFFIDYFVGKSASLNIQEKSIMATVMNTAGRKDEAKLLLQSVMEYLVSNDEMGSYFDTYKAEYSSCDYRIPAHVSAMEAIMRIGDNKADLLGDMCLWLLKQKQVQVWNTPVSSVNAIYAFLASGVEPLDFTSVMTANVGGKTITTPDDAIGHVCVSFQESEMEKINNISISRKGPGIGWASIYSQSLENMNNVKLYDGNGLRIERKYIYDGKEINQLSKLSVGDKVTVCITVSSDRDMDFVNIKDEKPACFEVASQISSYSWNEGISYYRVNKDASVEFFVDNIRKGSYTIRYDVFVTRSGSYVSGPASIISVYAPQFSSHSEGFNFTVE